MRRKSAALFWGLTAVLAILSGCMNGSGKGPQAEEGEKMFEFEGVPSPVVFANLQCNSWVPVDVKSSLLPAWDREFSAVDENAVFRPVAVLLSGSSIGVRCGGTLLVYGENGLFRFLEPVSEAAPVTFGRGAMAFVNPSLELMYQDYERHPRGGGTTVPGLVNWSVAQLLLPGEREAVVAVQFTGGPQRKPKRFSASAVVLRDGARRWFFDIEGNVDQSLLTNDGRNMVLIRGGEVEIRSVQDGKGVSSFKTGLSSFAAASLDGDDRLLLAGEFAQAGKMVKKLQAFDLFGKELWDYSGPALQNHQPPACGPDGRVYLVNGASLECLDNGARLWMCPLKSSAKSWITVAKDGSSVVLNGPWLSVISPQGERRAEKLVSADAEETFDAPPVIDSQGRIMVASGLRLSCFR